MLEARKCVIVLQDAQPAACVILNAAGEIIYSEPHQDLALLNTNETDEIIVVIPGQHCLLTEAIFPKLNAHRLNQAIPYALEEQLLDELHDLHFSHAPYTPDKPLKIAVIKKNKLEQCLELLKTVNIIPDVVIPSMFALPYQEHEWKILLKNNEAILRTSLFSGWVTDENHVASVLSLQFEEAIDKPEKITVYTNDGGPKPVILNFAHTLVEQHTLTEKQLIEFMATSIHPKQVINLLQSSYAPQKTMRMNPDNKKAWKRASLAFCLILGFIFLNKLGSFFILSLEHQYLQHKIASISNEHFPNTVIYGNIKERFKNKLDKISLKSDRNHFLLWLSLIAKQAHGIQIEHVNYQNNQLVMELKTASFSALENFSNALKAHDIFVQQQNAVTQDNQVKATLLLSARPV